VLSTLTGFMCRRRVGPRSRTARPPRGRGLFRLGTVVALALIALLALPGTTAGAQPTGDKRQQLQDQIGDASAEESAALAQLQQIRDRKAPIDARVAELDTQVSAAEAKLAPLVAEAEQLAGVLQEAEAHLARTQAKLDRAQEKLDHSAAEMYTSARSGASYERAVSSPPDDMVRGDRYLDHISSQRDQVLRRVRKLRDQVRAEKDAKAQQKAQADAAAAQAQAERDNVARLRAEIEPARAEAAQAETAEQQAVTGIQAKKAQYEAEYNQLQAASDYIASLLRGSSGGGPGAGHCEARPVPGAISSGFGMRYHPIYHTQRMHTGVDMHASYGEPIHACRSGTVVAAGWQGGYGNAVVIDHGGGMATLYAHQSRIAVSVGQYVDAGEVIGYVGSTGASTGPHLHFEVRLGGNPVDPAPYL